MVCITVNPVNTVSPVVTLLSKRILHIVDGIVVCRTEYLVACAKEYDNEEEN